MNKLHNIYLALGSNLGNKEDNILNAIELLEKRVGKLIAHSSFYCTTPVGFHSNNLFVNSACLLETKLIPVTVLEETKLIEQELGRTSKSDNHHYQDRIIDIDILFYDNVVLNTSNLTLPHPLMHKRLFVLEPMNEIACNYIHPILQQSISFLWHNIAKDEN